LEEAAQVEGANQWQLFYEGMFPLASRALVSGAILTWTRALGEFGGCDADDANGYLSRI